MKRHSLPVKLRILLGIWRRRVLLPSGPKPRPGARIFSGDVRLTVHDGMSDSLWRWLSRLGWREITFRPDRRRYQDIPDAWTKLLYEARSEGRTRALFDAVAAARQRTPHPQAFYDAHLKRQSHRLSQVGTMSG
ncbi:MAG TPA: hypothetical protein VFN64_01530 [Burkholderiaceae bacterium]|nr:hypothetical protein [Burkholderiaceae bacterium]